MFSSILTKAESAYNDPQYKYQWWSSTLGLEQAWKNQYTNQEIVVAVIDTGVQYDHEDLKEHIWTNNDEIPNNGVDDDHNGYVDDYYGWDFYNNDATTYSSVNTFNGVQSHPYDKDDHGTHVAGIIAASGNNGVGIVGIAHNVNVKIMNLKIFGGTGTVKDAKSIENAIKYAETNGARIVNASWCIDNDEEKIKRMIKESKMLFVCAAGNDQKDIDKYPICPAALKYNNTLSVAALDSSNTFNVRISNYGKESVNLAAPGRDIMSTIVGGYEYMDGTSMAAPMVTGTATLALAANPSLSAIELKRVINASVTPSPSLVSKTSTGGYVNTANTVTRALTTQHVIDKTKPSISCKVSKKKKSVSAKIKVADQGGSTLRLVRYAKGKKSAAYFKNGKKGTVISAKKTLTFKKKTTITIYALDFDGNAKTKTVTLSLKNGKKKGKSKKK